MFVFFHVYWMLKDQAACSGCFRRHMSVFSSDGSEFSSNYHGGVIQVVVFVWGVHCMPFGEGQATGRLE
jgi:hypothetical protein